MTLYKVFSFAGAGLCLAISLLFWLNGTFNDTLTGVTWIFILGFSVAAVVLFLVPFAFKASPDQPDISETFAGGPTMGAGGASPKSRRQLSGSLEDRMEARRQRVAAARAAEQPEQSDAAPIGAEVPTSETYYGLSRTRLVLLSGALLFLLGLGSYFYLMLPAGSPVSIIQQFPLITAATALFILSVSWRVSRGVANLLLGGSTSSGQSSGKKPPYTTERLARRRERLERARKDGKI